MRFKSAREILSPGSRHEVDWIAKPWIAKSAITDLVGKAKVAGKTTWALALCAAILDGMDFMGLPTSKTGIVYLTEQSEVTFRLSLERACIEPRDDFQALFWHETLAKEWRHVVDEAIDFAIERRAGLLVVDTLSQFANLTGDRENNSGDALEAMFPLQKARDRELGVLQTRHERKQGGQVGDSGRGSSAFAGAVDIIVNLARPRGNHKDTIRSINAVSRLDEAPPQLMIELGPDGYHSHGETTRPAADAARELVSIILPADENKAVSLEYIINTTSLPRATVQRVLDELKSKKEVTEIGHGVKGDPHRYFCTVHSAQNPSL
jgi:hypothetical protein